MLEVFGVTAVGTFMGVVTTVAVAVVINTFGLSGLDVGIFSVRE